MNIEQNNIPFKVIERFTKKLNQEQEEEILTCLEETIISAEKIGFGANAEVFKMHHPYQSICVKMLKKNRTIINTAKEEAEMQSKINELGVTTPKSLLRVKNQKTGQEYLLMERIEGYSLDQIQQNQEKFADIRKMIDVNFFQEVERMFKILHENKIHHRDFHSGNLMIDVINKKPVIIDFGATVETWTDDEDEIYRPIVSMRDPNDNKIKDTIQKFLIDKNEIKKMKEMFL